MEVFETRDKVKDGSELQDTQTYRESGQQARAFLDLMDDGVMMVPYVNWTVALLLGFLRQSNSHEDELASKIAESDFGSSRPEIVRRSLASLVKEGMVTSGPDELERGSLWLKYAITELGEAYLEYLANALVQYRREMDLFARIYEEQQRVSDSHRPSIKTSGCTERGYKKNAR